MLVSWQNYKTKQTTTLGDLHISDLFYLGTVPGCNLYMMCDNLRYVSLDDGYIYDGQYSKALIVSRARQVEPIKVEEV